MIAVIFLSISVLSLHVAVFAILKQVEALQKDLKEAQKWIIQLEGRLDDHVEGVKFEENMK